MCIQAFGQTGTVRQAVYLIPGQGSDARIYKNLHFDTILYKPVYLNWLMPEAGESLHDFAMRMGALIDATEPFSIIGVSLGGMVASELAESLHPAHVILISSAANAQELPPQYHIQQKIPVYKWVPGSWLKQASYIAQPVFEPDRKWEKETCVNMLHAKSPVFLERTVAMIIQWDKENSASNIVHIHGDADNTLPIKYVRADYIIHGGSHMMMLTRTNEIAPIIFSVLASS